MWSAKPFANLSTFLQPLGLAYLGSRAHSIFGAKSHYLWNAFYCGSVSWILWGFRLKVEIYAICFKMWGVAQHFVNFRLSYLRRWFFSAPCAFGMSFQIGVRQLAFSWQWDRGLLLEVVLLSCDFNGIDVCRNPTTTSYGPNEASKKRPCCFHRLAPFQGLYLSRCFVRFFLSLTAVSCVV